MVYNIVAGEELKKIMSSVLDNPIPFNEDMSRGEWHSQPFTDEFCLERASFHNVSLNEYKEKLSLFLDLIKNIKKKDIVNLYFGEDEVCVANRTLLIDYLKPKVDKLVLRIVDEYTGKEIKEPQRL